MAPSNVAALCRPWLQERKSRVKGMALWQEAVLCLIDLGHVSGLFLASAEWRTDCARPYSSQSLECRSLGLPLVEFRPSTVRSHV